jgi:hypothetical protein
MTFMKPPCLPLSLLLAISWLAPVNLARAADSAAADFSGIWRLNDQQSDSPSDIAARLRAERKREQPVQQPASAASAGTSASQSPTHSGHGGGHGMGSGGTGGSGHGHGGGRGQNKAASTDNGTAPADDPPPLLADDSIMNVQQDAKSIRVVLSDKDQLDGRLDGNTRQSLGGNAMVQTRVAASGMQIIMQFSGDVRLQQDWVRSPDGRHLTVLETWSTPAVQQPIVFRRSYDRLDI